MSILERMTACDSEQILFAYDEISGLKALIAIHDTTLGPAMGGLRLHPYASEDEALDDVLRLSKAMTFKAAAAGLNLGGGSAVILCDPHTGKTEELLRGFGRQVESLGGRFFIAQDAGTTVEDMETISQETSYVAGLRKSRGGSGDPAQKAAFGVLRGMQACLAAVFGESHLRNRTVAIQGLGAVGLELARLVGEEGARLIASDIDPRRIEKARQFLDLEAVTPEQILSTPCDVLSPCAMGGIFDQKTIPTLQARIIAGSANNQLASDDMGNALHARGIVYAPDFVVNAGGLINVAEELTGYDESTASIKIGKLYKSLETILRISRERGIPTHVAAHEMALERIRVIREVRRTYLPAEH
jgi:leucine dehydrogenase